MGNTAGVVVQPGDSFGDGALAGTQFDRILLIKPSSLGDVIHALPVLHGLREHYPNAEIHWLISSSLTGLLEGQPEIDKLVPFDRKRYGRIGRSWSASRDFASFLGRLREQKYDLVIDLQGLFRTGFLAKATGSATRIGFRSARESAWLFYSHHIPELPEDAHAVDRNRQVAALLGWESCSSRFGFSHSANVTAEAEDLLSSHGISEGEPFFAVVPGARWETKVWFPERFADVINLLGNVDGRRCVLLGGPDERDVCRVIAEGCGQSPIDLSGKTSLGVLPEVIRRSSCVLCHDSGAMHMAVAHERPLVCITGPTNPNRTGPYRRLEDVLRIDLACSPCYLRKLSRCGHDHRCMTEITPEMVSEAVVRRW